MVCSDSGECLAFGRNIGEIHKLFGGFTDFKYALRHVKKLGGDSVNGFVREITYKHGEYTARAALKSANNRYATNLVYEYHIGKRFINLQTYKFPCFISTYGLFYYNSDAEHDNMRMYPERYSDDGPDWGKTLTPAQIDYARACRDGQRACILIQHLKGVTFRRSCWDEHFLQYDAAYVLFIVYHALKSMSTQFTHYDLHDENVLLFRPSTTHVVEYVYHTSGGVIQFKCAFVPKIIDYGTAYCAVVSDAVLADLKTPDCKSLNGYGQMQGFTHLKMASRDGLTSLRKNESHDLRLAHGLTRIEETPPVLAELCSRIKYGVGAQRGDERYMTTEDTTLHPDGTVIANVTDMYNELAKLVTARALPESALPVLGTFHIYDDGSDMTYMRRAA
jgi:hypothetical protein